MTPHQAAVTIRDLLIKGASVLPEDVDVSMDEVFPKTAVLKYRVNGGELHTYIKDFVFNGLTEPIYFVSWVHHATGNFHFGTEVLGLPMAMYEIGYAVAFGNYPYEPIIVEVEQEEETK
jgi:hypothetical protein